MSHSGNYRTKQQEAILECMRNGQGKYVTVNQIDEYLKNCGKSVGLTTIYRQLEKLQKEGIVQKIMLDGNSGACYQYVNSDADNAECGFLLKCEDCGDIINMGCDHMSDLYEHVLEEHHFNVNPHRTMFYGTCEKCLSEKKKG